jgi:predicted P-loop ATPase
VAIDELKIIGRHDIFHNKKLIEGYLPENASCELSDDIVRRIREMIYDEFKYDPGKENVQEALESLCEKNRFDPVRDYLDSLTWDGVPRLDTLLSRYFGAEDTPLNRTFGRKTLIAGVRRARQPGCKFDTMLVLEGPQGSGKSTGIRILAGDENYSEQPIVWDDPKQQQEAVSTVWIYEIGELKGLRKADVEAVKSFLSRQTDRTRPAYGRYQVVRPRRCIFIGTTNNGEGLGYLTDPTGARRVWPVKTGRIDLEALKRDRDQLWAEAAAIEATGEELTIPVSLYEAARIEQDKRRATDPWADRLADVSSELADTPNGPVERISTVKLLSHLNIPADRTNHGTAVRLASVMRSLGWDGPKPIRVSESDGLIIRKEKNGTRVVKGYERPVKQ